MPHKHDKHFIPSPFPVVNEYEREFVKEWNDNTAMAVADLLKYIAKATAVAVKSDGKQIKQEIEEL